jgi:hypothetical protein
VGKARSLPFEWSPIMFSNRYVQGLPANIRLGRKLLTLTQTF